MIFIVPVKSVFQGALTEALSSKHGAALDFDQVTKVFPDGTHALDEVSFALDRGEFVSVVGASGCGKSTLLRIASGLLPASGGSYSLADENLGYVFQDATLLPWRTVQNNVELFAELHDIPSQERAALALDAIDLVGLTGFEGHHPRRLSGGMKMRVSLARSLTLSPKLFLFDEPFAALDEMTRERMADELLRLFASENFAALFITHNLYEAVYLSTRVLVMSARPGRIVAEFEKAFQRAARGVRNTARKTARIHFDAQLKYEAFMLSENEPCVQTALSAVEAVGLEPGVRISNGGLDANWMVAHGIPTVTLGCGQQDIHTVNESLHVESYLQACRVGLQLATGAG